MKKQIFLFALSILFAAALSAQKNHARNLKAEIDDEKVTFTFDMLPDGQYRYFNVCLKSFNASITPKSTSGDLGKNKAAGGNKKVYWYYVNDGYTQDQITNLKMDVVAINPLEPRNTASTNIKKAPIYAGFGGGSALGLGLLITGVTKNGDANEIYDIYKNNTSPNAQIYTELGQTREEVYEDANSKHKAAQYLTYGGGAVFAGAGAMLINRIIWMNKVKKINATRTPTEATCFTEPRFKLKPVYGGMAGVGLGLTVSF